MNNFLKNSSRKLTNSKQDKIHMFDVLNRDGAFLLNSCVNDRNDTITKMLLLISVSSIILTISENMFAQTITILILIIGEVSFAYKYKKCGEEILKIKSDIITDKKKYMAEML
jgi:hypothetical protein